VRLSRRGNLGLFHIFFCSVFWGSLQGRGVDVGEKTGATGSAHGIENEDGKRNQIEEDR